MAIVLRCDFCGAEFTPLHKSPKGREHFGLTTYYVKPDGHIDYEVCTRYDCCSECEKAFYKMIDERNLIAHGRT